MTYDFLRLLGCGALNSGKGVYSARHVSTFIDLVENLKAGSSSPTEHIVAGKRMLGGL